MLVVGWLGWQWYASLVPATYDVMEMGVVEHGGGRAVEHASASSGHGGHGGHSGAGSPRGTTAVGVADLTGPRTGAPDVAVTLTARQGTVRLADGRRVTGYSLDGTSPGPEIRARAGDLVEVTLVNRSVADGATLHWHGVDLPNAEDGVAGVTQDAVPVGGRHTYRFVAEDAGTYWYHSHQVSHRQVRGGLFGTLVVEPPEASDDAVAADPVVAVHTYDGHRTVNGRAGVSRVDAAPGDTVRLRVVNTDNGPMRVWVSGAPLHVLAVDARDLLGTTDQRGRSLVVPAGGRADLGLTVPEGGARVDVGGGAAVVVGPSGTKVTGEPEPLERLDLLTYGEPGEVPFDVSRFDRSFDYDIGRRPGFVDGRPGFWWTVNGRLFPDVPMYLVEEGDVVRMTIRNTSGDVHPMHLHGHHALVLSRDGQPATGSPWWVDSLEVEDDETYEIAFVADNPGIWMDHCHNLGHAADGLVAHLAYAGVTGSYLVGHDAGGGAHNEPE